MKRHFLCFLWLCFISTSATAQISGLYQQGFEPATFPPPSWQVINQVGPTYTWARSTTYAQEGVASAFMRYDASAGGGIDWMIMPKYEVTATTDSLVFYMRTAYTSSYIPDSLSIKISDTDSNLVSFDQNLLALVAGVNYPTPGVWTRYALSLAAFNGQEIFIAFKHGNYDGNGVYVDNIRLGTVPPNEAMTFSINSPMYDGSGPNTYTATARNNGSDPQTFNMTMEINPGGFTSTKTVSTLAPFTNTPVTFDPWTPSGPGVYSVKVYTQLSPDVNHTNDTMTQNVNILTSFPNYGWSTQTPMTGGMWAGAQAFTKSCYGGNDTGYVYYISGNNAAFATVPTGSRLNLTTNTWQTIPNIPNQKQQHSSVAVNGKIYIPGGYAAAFSPTNINNIFDEATNTWTTGANMPTAVGDHGIGLYKDSLIYVVGGYTGSVDVNTVQIYNIYTNTWTTGTAKPGTAVSGGRMGISGNNIVFMGGYSQTLSATQDDAWMGTIDPMNPANITWTAIGDFPAGPRGRHAGGVSVKNDGRVYFTAGDPDGDGLLVQAETYAYNTISGAWEIGPLKPVAVSNVTNFVSIIANDSIYMVVMGGYNGAAVVTADNWLNLGPVDKASAAADTGICGPATITLNAYNGTAYSWSPAASLNDSTLANPTATVNASTTYHVEITQKYGCPVEDSIVVTINTPPVIDNYITNNPLCNGDNNGSIEVNVTGNNLGYAWSSSDMDDVADNLGAGAYTVIVTDTVTGCTVNGGASLTEPAALNATSANVVATGCTGSLTATATGGTPGYTYLWNDPASQTTATATGLCGGTYTCTITDDNGCTTTVSATVTQNTAGIENNDLVVVNLYPNPFNEQFTLSGNFAADTDVQVQLFTIDGKLVYTTNIYMAAGNQSQIINPGVIAKGIYQVVLRNGQQIISTQRIIKL